MVQETWIEVRLLAPAAMQEEASLYLTDLSGRGVIIEEEADGGVVVIRTFFLPGEFDVWAREQVQEYLGRLGRHGLFPLGLEIRQVASEDWAHAWKTHFKPLRVTSRLVIRPPWEEYPPREGEMVIAIYPGMAFGTGRHPTTALCLEALERVWEEVDLPLPPDAWQVLDVGTGTGILALAAARRGARVLAIDVDPEAVAAALENVRLNALEDMILVEDTLLTAIRQQFALILANLTALDLQQWAEALAGRVLAGGVLIASGFLSDDLPKIMSCFQALGLQDVEVLSREGWSVLVLRRP